jgi:hypothetical protein
MFVEEGMNLIDKATNHTGQQRATPSTTTKWIQDTTVHRSRSLACLVEENAICSFRHRRRSSGAFAVQ